MVGDTKIVLKADISGTEVPFIVPTNPLNHDLNMHLYDWIKQQTG